MQVTIASAAVNFWVWPLLGRKEDCFVMAELDALAERLTGFLVVWGCRQQDAPGQGSGGQWGQASVNGAFIVSAEWKCLGEVLSRW